MANYITILRLFLILPILVFSYLGDEFRMYSAILFALASLTDFLDGYIARKTGSTTDFGALIDLLSDKLLVSIVLIWILLLDPRLIIAIPTIIIITRELVISSIRQFLSESNTGTHLIVSFSGKFKTATQFISITLIIFSLGDNSIFNYLGIILLWISSCLGIYSLHNYFLSWKKNFDIKK